MRARHNSHHGMTRVEVVISALVLVLLLGIAWPALHHSSRVRDRQQCMANLKQIALGMNLGIQENFPIDSISKMTPNQSGSLENASGPNAYRLFQAFSNFIGAPSLLVCPVDDRKPATNWTTLRNANTSYFGDLDYFIEPSIKMIPFDAVQNHLLFGDRYVTNNGFDPRTYLLSSSNNPPQWTRAHSRDSGIPYGFFAVSDGSVQTSGNERMALQAKQLGNTTQRLAVP